MSYEGATRELVQIVVGSRLESGLHNTNLNATSGFTSRSNVEGNLRELPIVPTN